VSTQHDGSSDKISVEVVWFKMSAGTTAVLTEVFCALPQSLQVNTGLEPKFRLWSVPSVHLQYSLFVTTGLHIFPIPGRRVTKFRAVAPDIFSVIIAIFIPYIQKCVSVHMHRPESAR